jgi:hypothetical protein
MPRTRHDDPRWRLACKWIRMVLPFALDHINLWLLRDRLDGPRGLDGGGLLHHP